MLASRGSVVHCSSSNASVQASNNYIAVHDTIHYVIGKCGRLSTFCFEHGESGDLYVQKAPAATILQLANATMKYSGKTDDYPIFDIGYRHGKSNMKCCSAKKRC